MPRLYAPATTQIAIIRRRADLPARDEQRPFRFAPRIGQEKSMVTHIRSAVAPRRVPPPPPPQPPEPEAGPLERLGSIEDEDHILVVGKDGLDLMCALLRAGATQVTHLCSHERPEADSASLAI